MNYLILEWIEAGQAKQQQVSDQQISRIPGMIRIGRDATQSDIVISDMSVAPCHIEIFFNPQQQCFYLRNLRDTNPPVINGMLLRQGEAMLDEGSMIQLGVISLQVSAVRLGQQAPPRSSSGYTPTSYATQVSPNPTPPPTIAATNYQQAPPTVQNYQPQATVQPTVSVSPAYQPPTPTTAPKPNRKPLFLGLGAAVLTAIVAGIVIASMPKLSTTSSLTTQASQTTCSATVTGSIRSEPASFRDNKLNFEGNQFTVTGKQTVGGWVELKLPNDSLGWAHRDVISNGSEMDSCLQRNGVSVQTAEDIAPPPKPVQAQQSPSQIDAQRQREINATSGEVRGHVEFVCQCTQDPSNFTPDMRANAKALGPSFISAINKQGESCGSGRAVGILSCTG